MSQTYGSAISIMLGAPTQTTDANNVSTIVTFDNFGRTTQRVVANRATLLYNYTEGMLSSIVRSADNAEEGNKLSVQWALYLARAYVSSLDQYSIGY